MTKLTLATLAALACMALASSASALPYCVWTQTISIGTVDSGNSGNLCACDNTKEVLKEALDNGVSKLRAKWTFSQVGPGTIVLHYKATRPNNSDGETYQFYYNTTGGDFGILIPGAVIDHNFAPADGMTFTLETTTTMKDFTILLSDTAGGTNLDTVSLDCVYVDDGNND